MAAIDQLRDLPQVDTLAGQIEQMDLPRQIVVGLVRTALDIARQSIASGVPADPRQTAEDLVLSVNLSRSTRVLNATGVLLHTNLGRAPLSQSAVEAMSGAAGNYTNLEIQLAGGERGGRGSYTIELIRALTGSEAALVVNNNAAAVALALAATARGKAVPVARGELIEIGGSYRLPEVMAASGARLVEVGTTNRTRVTDYATAMQLYDTGALLKVHPSNFRVEGFTEETGIGELAEEAARQDLPLIFDIGSGHLDDDGPWLEDGDRDWLGGEPAARQALAAGASLVTFSGDKLIGGPQAGLIAGNREVVERIREHPQTRAMRLDAARDAALAATLEDFLSGDVSKIPLWSMARMTTDALQERVDALRVKVGGDVVMGSSLIGAGSVPGKGIATPQLWHEGAAPAYSRLLGASPPVVVRRRDAGVITDLRTVSPGDDGLLADILGECL